jgi:hypothetical protein
MLKPGHGCRIMDSLCGVHQITVCVCSFSSKALVAPQYICVASCQYIYCEWGAGLPLSDVKRITKRDISKIKWQFPSSSLISPCAGEIWSKGTCFQEENIPGAFIRTSDEHNRCQHVDRYFNIYNTGVCFQIWSSLAYFIRFLMGTWRPRFESRA